MRGKKNDTEFIVEFINNCLSNNKIDSNQILQEAKDEIQIIERKIIEAEKLKLRRSKLLDVVSCLNNESKKSSEANKLIFYQLEYPHICYEICNKLQDNMTKISNIDINFPNTNIQFCIKQLVKLKIINKIGQYVCRGELYKDYIDFGYKGKNVNNISSN